MTKQTNIRLTETQRDFLTELGQGCITDGIKYLINKEKEVPAQYIYTVSNGKFARSLSNISELEDTLKRFPSMTFQVSYQPLILMEE